MTDFREAAAKVLYNHMVDLRDLAFDHAERTNIGSDWWLSAFKLGAEWGWSVPTMDRMARIYGRPDLMAHFLAVCTEPGRRPCAGVPDFLGLVEGSDD
jgi:hypothetical protein